MSCLATDSNVQEFLLSRDADRDENDTCMVAGPEPPVSFMGGGDEWLIPDSLVYLVDGKPFPLAAGLVEAKLGFPVAVVGEAPCAAPEAAS